jgi:hypothetical protein
MLRPLPPYVGGYGARGGNMKLSDVNRLGECIANSPLLDAIYRCYQNGDIEYDEMLVQMILQGNQQHDQLMAEHLKYIERYGTPKL